MRQTHLTKRLQAVADFVPQGARLADIGSDHAYLPLYLVETGRIAFAVAGEVVAGPYQSAVDNVVAAGQAHAITVRLADGLAAVEEHDQIDTITIAGMGGRLIASILEAGPDVLRTAKRLVLQPNNREDDLRQWLAQNGWRIVNEEILLENGKFYELMVAEKGQMELSASQLRFGPILSAQQSPIFTEKWQREACKLEQALSQIPGNKTSDRAVIETKLQAIKEVLQ